MYFGHKHLETGLSCLHELATFLKYHMPLKMYTNFLFSLHKKIKILI